LLAQQVSPFTVRCAGAPERVSARERSAVALLLLGVLVK
jgi:hypothetical protein